MNLLERAKKLQKLGFFEVENDQELKEIVTEASEIFGEAAEEAPATAILTAAGAVLEILPEAAAELDGYAAILEEIAEFCEDAFAVTDVKADLVDGKSVPLGDGGEPSPIVRLRFRLDGQSREVEVTHYPDLVDLSFLSEVDIHLDKIKSKKRLCPLVELMDDVARYVFIEPAIMENAEEKEIITAPDFEDEEPGE